jgi:DNA-binding IclR family transcriptional regulator
VEEEKMSEQVIELERPVGRCSRDGKNASAKAVRLRVASEQPDKVVKSAGRVLRILEFFDVRRGAANVIDVARALQMPQSSTSVLLRSLTLMGYLEYNSRSRTYWPTSRVAILGNWVNPLLVQRGGVLDAMRELSARTGQIAVLAARNALSAQCIHVTIPEAATEAYDCGHQIGETHQLATSAPGLIFLSLMPDLEVAKVIRRVNAYSQDGKIVRVADLLLRLAEIRKKGYAYYFSEGEAGCATLAMQVPNAQGPLAVALSGSRTQIEGSFNLLAATLRSHVAGLTKLADSRSVYLSQ